MTKPNKKEQAFNAGVKRGYQVGQQDGLRIGANVGIAMALSTDHTDPDGCLSWVDEDKRYSLTPSCPVCRDISEATGIPLTEVAEPKKIIEPAYVGGLEVITT